MYDWISETCTFPTHYFTCDVIVKRDRLTKGKTMQAWYKIKTRIPHAIESSTACKRFYHCYMKILEYL